jgi:hypothetical protein
MVKHALFPRVVAPHLRATQQNCNLVIDIATRLLVCDTHCLSGLKPSGSGVMEKTSRTPAQTSANSVDWRRSISDHVAYALLVYTALQIFVTVHALDQGASGALPYLALIVLVGGIIPVLRRFEARWADLDDAEAANLAYAAAFRRDITALWAVAIGLPFALTLLFKMVLGAL